MVEQELFQIEPIFTHVHFKFKSCFRQRGLNVSRREEEDSRGYIKFFYCQYVLDNNIKGWTDAVANTLQNKRLRTQTLTKFDHWNLRKKEHFHFNNAIFFKEITKPIINTKIHQWKVLHFKKILYNKFMISGQKENTTTAKED